MISLVLGLLTPFLLPKISKHLNSRAQLQQGASVRSCWHATPIHTAVRIHSLLHLPQQTLLLWWLKILSFCLLPNNGQIKQHLHKAEGRVVTGHLTWLWKWVLMELSTGTLHPGSLCARATQLERYHVHTCTHTVHYQTHTTHSTHSDTLHTQHTDTQHRHTPHKTHHTHRHTIHMQHIRQTQHTSICTQHTETQTDTQHQDTHTKEAVVSVWRYWELAGFWEHAIMTIISWNGTTIILNYLVFQRKCPNELLIHHGESVIWNK